MTLAAQPRIEGRAVTCRNPGILRSVTNCFQVQVDGRPEKRMRRICIAVGACMALVLVSSPTLQAQDWPTRPIKIVTPLAAGGAADVICHAVREALTGATKLAVGID